VHGSATFITATAEPAPVQVVRTLRADPATFTGRTAVIDKIRQAVAAAAGGVVAIHAIDGMPGVGKTTLAIHVAHLLADQYPDGQLMVDLHAHSIDHASADPADVLADLLTATYVSADNIPPGLERRSAAWRDRVAGKRLLLVYDNAATGAQVAPLLPGSPGCLVLITSRSELTSLRRDPGAIMLSLDVLPEPDAVALFARICGHPLDANERAELVEVVQLCGCLPMAIAILAADHHPDRGDTVAGLHQELKDTQDRLAVIDRRLGDGGVGMAAAFTLSYHRLKAEEQRFLRLIALTPGTDIDLYATAALTDLSLPTAGEHLRALCNHHLAEQRPRPYEQNRGQPRYRLHDLITVYARAQAIPSEYDEAVGRLLDYYQHTASIAAARTRRRTAPPHHTVTPAAPSPTPDLPDYVRATTWLRTERANLLACLTHTRQQKDHARTVDLTASLAPLLRADGPWTDGIDLHAQTLAIVRGLGDRMGEAWTLGELGVLRRLTGDYPQATTLHEQALTIRRELGDRNGEAYTLADLGALRRLTGDYPQATTLQEQALTIFRELGDRMGEAWTLAELGALRRATGDYPHATTLLEQALTIFRDIGGRNGEAWTLAELGVLRRVAGDYPQAISLLGQSLTIRRELADRQGEVEVLNHQGDLLQGHSGEHEQARAHHSEALQIARRLGTPLDEARSLAGIGRCAAARNDADGVSDMQRALRIFQQLGAAEATQLATELDALAERRAQLP
jgi:tetratricopeptide (TPR) repeat protein